MKDFKNPPPDFTTGWGSPIKMNEWETSMIWCPSQMHYGIEYEGKKFAIYCRWRHSDPWTAILEAEGYNFFDLCWNLVEDMAFTQNDDIGGIQKFVLKKAKDILPKAYKEIK